MSVYECVTANVSVSVSRFLKCILRENLWSLGGFDDSIVSLRWNNIQ